MHCFQLVQHTQNNITAATVVVVDTRGSPYWGTFILEITLSNERRGILHGLKCISSIEVLYSVTWLHNIRKEVTPKQPLQGKRLKQRLQYWLKSPAHPSESCKPSAWMVFLFTIAFYKDLVLGVKVRSEMLQHEISSSAPAQVRQLDFNNCTQWSEVSLALHWTH